VAFNLSAGNITASGTTDLQAVSATSLASASVQTDTLTPITGGAVTCDGNLTCTGRLTVAGVQVANGSVVIPDMLTVGGTNVLAQLGGKQDQLTQEGFGTELLYESNKLKRVQFGSGLVGGTDLQPDGSQNVFVSVSPNLSVDSLTLDGVNVANALAAREPAFTAVAPLQKAFNIQTGQLELRVNTTELGGNPFWIAGKVLGTQSTPTVVASKGRVGFSVTRRDNLAGQYIVRFDQDHPDGSDYVITLTIQATGIMKVQQFSSALPDPTGFDAIAFTPGASSTINADFYVTVLA
jgi:hypothetical protein